jgi:voltage-gated potassium channel Kch
MIIRIWERPYYELALAEPFFDFRWYGSAIWYVLISMTTVGYGNIVATTPYGRVSVIVAILVGSFLLALLVGLIINWFSLPSNQEDAINNIELQWFAVKSVRASLEYNVARQKRNRFLRN